MKVYEIIGLSVLVTLSLLIPPMIFGFDKISHLTWVDWVAFVVFISGSLLVIDTTHPRVHSKEEEKNE